MEQAPISGCFLAGVVTLEDALSAVFSWLLPVGFPGGTLPLVEAVSPGVKALVAVHTTGTWA